MMRQFFLCFLSFLVLSTAAFGQVASERKGPEFPEREGPRFEERKGMMGPMHPPMEDWVRQLNLTAEQMARLQEMRESYLRDTLVWRNELVIKRFDLRDLWRNPQVDPNQVLAKQREISELESKIQERAVLYQLEMRKVLTPEQIKLLPPGFGFGGFRGWRMMPGWGRGMGRE
jgi:Spy/CpxP family protein refolding chaperone